MARYLKDKTGFIYDWNPILAKNPDCVEVTEQEAFPEKFIPEKQKGRKAKVSLTTENIPTEPEHFNVELGEEAARGL